MKQSMILKTFIVLFASMYCTAQAHADEKLLTGRLGVGFTKQIAVSTSDTASAISAKYYFSRLTAASLALGFDTRSSDSIMAVGLKVYRTLFAEENLFFYGGGGAAYVSRNGSKAQLMAFLGSEFFLSGLPSLGFSFEVGARGDSYSGNFSLKTTGDSFLTGGIHFYF